jgi:formamidase
MAETLIKVDLSKPLQTQEVLHNCWNPDIPMIAHVKPGDEFRVECVDWIGGQNR